MMRTRSTGILGLDAQLGGGYPTGSLLLLTGMPINAYELMAYHFATGHKRTLYQTGVDDPSLAKLQLTRVGAKPDHIRLLRHNALQPELNEDTRFVLEGGGRLLREQGIEHFIDYLIDLRKQTHQHQTEAMVLLPEHIATPAEMSRIIEVVDGVLDTQLDRQGFGLFASILVKKLRQHPTSTAYFIVKETPGGLFMESTRRVN